MTEETKTLWQAVNSHLVKHEDVAEIIGSSVLNQPDLAHLFGALLGELCGKNTRISQISTQIYLDNPKICANSAYDIIETARRNFEPGGAAGALLFSRGVQAILAHRVAHQLWLDDKKQVALAFKTLVGRILTTDIHPAAEIGKGLWLDHGLGFVVGETAVIEDNVSIWHNVTLGSTLNDSGLMRHPRIETGAVIGAGATLLGGITIGAGATVAAGAIVLESVPAQRVIAGQKATLRGKAKISFAELNSPSQKD